MGGMGLVDTEEIMNIRLQAWDAKKVKSFQNQIVFSFK